MKKILIGVVLAVAAVVAVLAIGGDAPDPPEALAAVDRVPERRAVDAGGTASRPRSPAAPKPTPESTMTAEDQISPANPALSPTPGGKVPEGRKPRRRKGGAAAKVTESEPSDSTRTAARMTAQSQTPTAEEILLETAATYADIRSLKADFVQRFTNPLLGGETTSRGTLYQKGEDLLLLRFTQPEGDVIVSDGEYVWIYYPSVNPDQVIRTPAGGPARGVDLRAQLLGDPLERFDVTLEGTEPVAGRKAYVLTLVPTRPARYEKLRIWVDARDHLVRRFEIVQPNGSVRHFELRNLQVNPDLDDELFEFTPPPGVRVVTRG